jgi:glutamate synthase (ferredoxin)
MVFLPKRKPLILQDDFETAIRNQNLNIGWRDVPVDVSNLGQIAAEKKPKQVFIGKNGLELTEQQFNAKLFAARKLLTIQVQRLQKVICSISSYLHHYLYMDY